MAKESETRVVSRRVASTAILGIAALVVAFGRSMLGSDRVIVIVTVAVVLNVLILVDYLRARLRK